MSRTVRQDSSRQGELNFETLIVCSHRRRSGWTHLRYRPRDSTRMFYFQTYDFVRIVSFVGMSLYTVSLSGSLPVSFICPVCVCIGKVIRGRPGGHTIGKS